MDGKYRHRHDAEYPVPLAGGNAGCHGLPLEAGMALFSRSHNLLARPSEAGKDRV